ncbi:winged helix-turn-helix domain-containing protein [Kineosporia sp. NBRC 101731]|uniref:ArsR/SmtB family transcription factor n=1 Tax=Kineosporia sp. NBRC 101731 TaxID=3032199 RepID=UPI0024A53AD6|nr:winged helix-turn-helix domain-containing protein [Kineosporia sp. NBRC 101731]GLY30496.1 ArsR family transcriptional regulator [Kineosporia sp. NBRC 101731]
MSETSLRITVDADDIASSRFAVSPAGETVHLVAMLARRRTGHPPLLRRFARRWGTIRNDPGVRALASLQRQHEGVDFTSPPPAGMGQTIQDDLAAVRSGSVGAAREEMAQILGPPGPETGDDAVASVLGAPDVLDQLADAVERAWDVLLRPEWPRLLAVLQRDVQHRAGRLVALGWAAGLEGVHPRLGWHGGQIRLSGRPDETVSLAGRGLLFVPSVFLTQGLALSLHDPRQPMIRYSCRGTATLWESRPLRSPALAPLIGGTRARLLETLADPGSTTQIAGVLQASLGATGGHLRVLLDAGLVTRERVGRSVVYRRTELGDSLAGSNRES